jgi:hypothetical protein
MIKSGVALLVFSMLVGVIYAVLFMTLYPRIPFDTGIASLCALAGIATCLLIAGLWKLIVGARP